MRNQSVSSLGPLSDAIREFAAKRRLEEVKVLTYIAEMSSSGLNCPPWYMQTTHTSDEFAVEYWRKRFASCPNDFPPVCDQLLIHCNAEGHEHFVAKIVMLKREVSVVEASFFVQAQTEPEAQAEPEEE